MSSLLALECAFDDLCDPLSLCSLGDFVISRFRCCCHVVGIQVSCITGSVVVWEDDGSYIDVVFVYELSVYVSNELGC